MGFWEELPEQKCASSKPGFEPSREQAPVQSVRGVCLCMGALAFLAGKPVPHVSDSTACYIPCARESYLEPRS